MCIIVDNNCSSDMMSDKPYAELIKDWVEDGGKVVTGGKLLDEVSGTKARELLEFWRANNRLIVLERESVEAEEAHVQSIPHSSDDEHVLAVARLSQARVLVTKDANLMADFTSRSLINPRGRVLSEPAYNAANLSVQRNLLRQAGCR